MGLNPPEGLKRKPVKRCVNCHYLKYEPNLVKCIRPDGPSFSEVDEIHYCCNGFHWLKTVKRTRK